MINLICIFKGHEWTHSTHYPLHGWYNQPVDGAVCDRCGKVNKEERVTK